MYRIGKQLIHVELVSWLILHKCYFDQSNLYLVEISNYMALLLLDELCDIAQTSNLKKIIEINQLYVVRNTTLLLFKVNESIFFFFLTLSFKENTLCTVNVSKHGNESQ